MVEILGRAHAQGCLNDPSKGCHWTPEAFNTPLLTYYSLRSAEEMKACNTWVEDSERISHQLPFIERVLTNDVSGWDLTGTNGEIETNITIDPQGSGLCITPLVGGVRYAEKCLAINPNFRSPILIKDFEEEQPLGRVETLCSKPSTCPFMKEYSLNGHRTLNLSKFYLFEKAYRSELENGEERKFFLHFTSTQR